VLRPLATRRWHNLYRKRKLAHRSAPSASSSVSSAAMTLYLPKRTLTLDSGEAITSLSVSPLRAALDDRNVASSGSKGQLCDRLLSCRPINVCSRLHPCRFPR